MRARLGRFWHLAEAEGREKQPVTERGRPVHAARQARTMFREMRERLELARDTYGLACDGGQGRVSAGSAALRCQWQFKFPHFGQSKIPQFIGVRLSAVDVTWGSIFGWAAMALWRGWRCDGRVCASVFGDQV